MDFEADHELLDAMLPLWLALPVIPRYFIGWRMGEGEAYAWDFSRWWDKLSPAAQQKYQQRYPEPVGWRGWYREEDLDEENEDKQADSYEIDGVCATKKALPCWQSFFSCAIE